ncbi:maleylacetoacetate isomerase [Sphingobium phenoxybenzoativorans]|uniref:maleylacetoacetate isomerase n=1 Tax=Sphingobium phenoxybenzoativorans TaxID=1592790 RepID=UPI0008726BF8|nr:maleylacetoacetate isomerase [Sphingobium phenoxybenzoativorans]
MKLHGYFRSSASFRVRIALNLKGVAYEDIPHHLVKGEQRAPDYLTVNPQGLVPALEVEGAVLTQSLAICEYLDERYPDPPLLPGGAIARAQVRAFAQVIACDIHPVQNLRVLKRVKALSDTGAAHIWARETIEEGLASCAELIAAQPGPYCFGAAVTLADIFLIPQLFNARRFDAAIPDRLLEAERACLTLDAFQRALPQNQPDAE